MIDCDFRSNYGSDCGGVVHAEKSTLVMSNSTMAENTAFYCGMLNIDETVFSFHNCTFRDFVGTGMRNIGIIAAYASGSFTDCLIKNNFCAGGRGLLVLDGSAVSIERTVFVDNRNAGYNSCLGALSGASITVDDSDLINCHSEGSNAEYGGATIAITTGGMITITNSRIVGSQSKMKGTLAYLGETGTLRIASSTITDNGGDGKFAIYSKSGSDFAVQVRVRKSETGDGEHSFVQHEISSVHTFAA